MKPVRTKVMPVGGDPDATKFYVDVSYEGGIDDYQDDVIELTARELGASVTRLGSGCLLIVPFTRDIQFGDFESHQDAQEFAQSMSAKLNAAVS